ncbi:hypothetical protein AXF42_Ash000248 [Apostasia shenzhenica]|uniref:AC transposase n=1 Tax=Apostasia shenzhenica TaxID=1088818 RepID=A0A2I0AFW5_9ASPA|nr:hypothetical protein AXF42_Ash000248 [Apostasia shenzhenica]
MMSSLCVSPIYEHNNIKNIIAKMIIVHEYHFMMVEHLWFNVLMRSMNTSYCKITRQAIKNECVKVHEFEKEYLKKVLKTVDRVSLTCDCWTSNQTIG